MLASKDVIAAHARIARKVLNTPVIGNSLLNERFGCEAVFKCENLQTSGAFKLRGASNAIALLDKNDYSRGVATHSSGNHGAALALAAQREKITCTVVVPHGAPQSKIDNMLRYGAHLVRCEATQISREETLADVARKSGAEIIPPYDDDRIICGQGTAAFELIQFDSSIECLLTPVGGGGLLSGTCLIARNRAVFAAEPLGADDAAQSLKANSRITTVKPETIADGLRATIGERNFAIISKQVDAIFTVTEAEIIAATRVAWEHLKMIIEPSSAVVVAALLQRPAQLQGKKVGVILSGGNVDLDTLPWQQ